MICIGWIEVALVAKCQVYVKGAIVSILFIGSDHILNRGVPIRDSVDVFCCVIEEVLGETQVDNWIECARVLLEGTTAKQGGQEEKLRRLWNSISLLLHYISYSSSSSNSSKLKQSTSPSYPFYTLHSHQHTIQIYFPT